MKKPQKPTAKAVDISATFDWLVIAAAVLGLAVATYSIVQSTTIAPNDGSAGTMPPEQTAYQEARYQTF